MAEEVQGLSSALVEERGIRPPPESLGAALQQIGPGIILAGTIVGSGELLLTTKFGARHGFVFLWLILFSCVIKVFVQVELGRYAISSGLPTLGALKNISNYRLIGNVLLAWWLVMMCCTTFQLGGMTGGVGQSLNMAFPNFAEWIAGSNSADGAGSSSYLSSHPETPWAILTCLVTMALIVQGGYRRIEKFTTALVVGVTTVTVVAMLSLWMTPYAPSATDIFDGLKCKIPGDGIADAFAVFGITGVGATELFYYPYWCIEKGYAKFVGPNDGSSEWESRAQGWIKVMHLDAWISMIVFTLSTIAFYFMGAAVLHPQQLIPEGAEMIRTLAEMYRGPFGAWTQILFLLGAGAVLFKTLYLACAANSRMIVDFLALNDVVEGSDPKIRQRWIQVFCMIFPLIALTLYLFYRDPQFMIKLGGIAQAATLPMMAGVTLYFRYHKLDQRLKPWFITDICLWLATISIIIVALYAVPNSAIDIYNFIIRSSGK